MQNLARFHISVLLIVATLTLICSVGTAQTSHLTAPAVPNHSAGTTVHTGDEPDVLRETQLGLREQGYSGLIWWIPIEFWEESAMKRGATPQQAEESFKALKDYTVVGVFAAKVSSLGSFEFVPGAEIRKNVMLRDARGSEYPFVQEPSQDAKNLAAMIKPILSGAIGKAGENFELLFFPARTKAGEPIADAQRKGDFSVVLKGIAGVPESVYQWRLPLTSVTAPKYCPIGKERVNANWEYCPWHGTALNTAK